MESLKIILLAIVGNTAVMAVLGWFAKSFVERLLTRDIEQFKANLNAETEKTLEHLRYELQRITMEHQIRFSKLHEKRAAVVAELYNLLNETYWATNSLISFASFPSGSRNEENEYKNAEEKIKEFFLYFYKNQIYFSKKLANLLDQFINNLMENTYLFRDLSRLGTVIKEETYEEKGKRHAAWLELWRKFRNESLSIKSAIEDDFRSILGVS